MASHYLNNDDAFVACGSRVQPIKRVHHHAHCRIKPKRHRRGFQIVVDCLWNPYDVDASLLQLLRGDHRAVATHNDQCFYLKFIEDLFGTCNYVRGRNGAITPPTLAAKWPRFVVPMIVPPSAMIPSMLLRSRTHDHRVEEALRIHRGNRQLLSRVFPPRAPLRATRR